MATSMRKIERKDEADLLHGDDGGTIFKYDLPVLNMPITFHNKLVKVDKDDEREMLTSTQKLFDELDADKDTAFESFIIKFRFVIHYSKP